MALFKTKAKATHKTYGICRYEAVLLCFENRYIIYIIKHKRSTNHKVEKKNQFNLKKKSDHKALMPS